MRWLRHSVSGIRRPAGRGRPAHLLRRRPAIEPLEDRRLLATLDLDLQLYADDSGSRGDPIEYVRVGDTFFVSVTADDERSSNTSAGVIALPLDLQWRKDIINYRSEDLTPALFPNSIPLPTPEVPIPNAVITPSFRLQRFVNEFDVGDAFDSSAGKILGLRGASLPAFGVGQAIGAHPAPTQPGEPPYNEFSLIHFEAVGAGWAMPFKMRLAGSMSFADAAPLDALADADENAINTVTRHVRVQAVASGMKYEDLNGNGRRDEGEPPLTWEIRAYLDQDGDRKLQQNEYEAGAVTTAVTRLSDGGYELLLDTGEPSPEGSCPAGTSQSYIIVEVLQEKDRPQTEPLTEVLDFDSDELGKYGYAETVIPCDPNTHLRNLNFGNGPLPTTTTAGRKYEDLNADGDDESGVDPGRDNWRITAFADANADGVLQQSEIDAGAANSVLTANGGLYSLTLDPGKYVVVETLQSSWFESPDADATEVNPNGLGDFGKWGYAIALSSRAAVTGNDFGNYRQATAKGRKYEDLNADGDDEGGMDPGRDNWQITAFVDANADDVLQQSEIDAGAADSVLTANGGLYSLTLDPGKYIVVETAQNGWFESPDADATEVNPNGLGGYGKWGYAIALSSGEQRVGNDFGNYQKALKSGYKWHDLNADGIWQQGEEPPLSDWWICVYADTGNVPEELDPGDQLVDCRHSADGGLYSFFLDPGKYIVVEASYADWYQSWPKTEVDGGTLGYADCGYAVTLTSGQVDDDNDFGNYQKAMKEGVKYQDVNFSRVYEPGADKPLSGWIVYAYKDTNQNSLLDASDEPADPPSQTTGDDGQYSFSLDPGKYIIVEESRSDWCQSQPTTDVDGGVKGHAENGYAVTLVSGEVDDENDFGNNPCIAIGSLSGFVYADVDKDAQRDLDEQGAPIELGVPKVEIALLRDGQVVKTDWTGPDGWYHFEDLEPGMYDIAQVTQPACFIDGTETPGIILPGGESRGTAGNDRFTGITIAAGEHGIDYNFGELGLTASCVNKSMVLGSSNVRQATVYDPRHVKSAEVKGTKEHDTFRVTVGPTAISVTVNSDPPQTFPFADVQIVSLNGLDGEDTITVTGSDADESAHFQPGYFVYRNEACQAASDGTVACDWDWAIEAISFERVTANAGDSAGRDLAVLRDSTAKDVLTATDGTATIDLSDQELEHLAFEHVRAISTRGGADEAGMTTPLYFELELLGDWSTN